MRYSYDSFGYPRIIQGSGTGTTMVDFRNYSGNKYSNTRLYTGREHDRETGLYYHRARYYDSDTGRFTSRDPIGQNDQVNLYTYVRNSPLMYTDPSGKIIKQAITTGWDNYLDGSQRFGSNMYDAYSENKNEIIGAIDRTRRYSGNLGLIVTPFLFVPPTTPFAAGVIGATGVMSVSAGGIETVITGDNSYVITEGAGLVTSKFGGKLFQGLLDDAGKATEVIYNSSAKRYMGRLTNGTYGFMKNSVGQISVAISQVAEQATGLIGQKLIGNSR